MISGMSVPDLLGYTAAFLTTTSFVPQAWLTFRTRDVSGISLGMYSAFTLGIALWLVYGVVIDAWPIVAANAVTLLLALSILLMKLRYGRHAVP
jgi:MtN3 and saliva related transmembrane protein